MTALRWAIAQPRMHWTLAGNLAEIQTALQAAAAAGAAGCVCTELALTGFHRRLPELLDPAGLEKAQARLRASCEALRIAAVIGMPTLGAGGAIFNSHVFIDATGVEVARVHKRGLTPSEASFFTPGLARGWTALGGVLATSVLCREMLDVEALRAELRSTLPAGAAGPRVIFWPSYVGASDAEQAALCRAYREGARELATALDAWVLQANWPEGLNLPGQCGFGGSVVIAPGGRVMLTLPEDRPALEVVRLA